MRSGQFFNLYKHSPTLYQHQHNHQLVTTKQLNTLFQLPSEHHQFYTLKASVHSIILILTIAFKAGFYVGYKSTKDI